MFGRIRVKESDDQMKQSVTTGSKDVNDDIAVEMTVVVQEGI